MKRSHFISRTINGLSNLIIPEDQRGEVLTFDTKGKQEAGLPVGQLPIVYQPDYPYIMVDPRVSFLKRVLSLILQHHNSYLNPFAFRLRSLKDWTIKVVVENFISQMAWACKSNCVFCYQKGNPPFMKTKIRMSRAEIMTRLKYFTGETCLIYGMQYESDEVLNNPYIKQILRVVRANTCEEIRIPTNGNSLTPEFISFLRTMRPISLLVSINSADARTRTQFTGDAHPEIAIRSFSLLKEHGIPYFASIVAWPGLPFSDIEKTIKYAEKNDAWGVRVSLPGYSRYFSPQKPFDDKKYWIRIVKYICLLKKK